MLVLGATTPRRLLAASALGFAAVFAALAAYGRPGLGISQIFYVPVALAALAGGALWGAGAGVAALVLYALALAGTWDAAQLEVRLGAYVAAGATIGWFAARARGLLADSLHVLDDLLAIARRDVVTAGASSRGLESAINRRLDAGESFALLVGDARNDDVARSRDDRARAIARALQRRLGPGDELARVGECRFAVLVPAHAPSAAASLERELLADGCDITFGWATSPSEGRDALSLFGVAAERLHARRLVRGEWAPTAVSAGLVAGELGRRSPAPERPAGRPSAPTPPARG